MKRNLIMSGTVLLLSSLLLVGCGNKGSQGKAASSASSSTSTASSSASNSSSVATSSVTSSADSSTASSSSSNNKYSNISDKVIGTMVNLLWEPDSFKDGVKEGVLYYGVTSNSSKAGDLAGYSYITSNGDPMSYIDYKRDGNLVTYKYWVIGKTVADGHTVTKTVTVDRLVQDYYVNQDQKDEVNGYANELKPEADYEKQVDANLKKSN